MLKPLKINPLNIFIPIFILVFTGIMLYVLVPTLNQDNYILIQKETFLKLNHFLSQSLPIYSYIWKNLTDLGNGLVAILLLSFLLPRQAHIWAGFFAAIPVAELFSVVGKQWAKVPRPSAVLEHDTFTIIGQVISGHTSLPSGHSISIFTFISVLLLLNQNKKNHLCRILIGILFASILALSRIAVGAHWPLDIVIGGALGYLAGLSGVFLVLRYSAWWIWLKNPNFYYIIVLLIWGLIYLLLLKNPSFTIDNTMIWLASASGMIVSIRLIKAQFILKK